MWLNFRKQARAAEETRVSEEAKAKKKALADEKVPISRIENFHDLSPLVADNEDANAPPRL
jgi:hypothetical protein